MSCCLFLLVVHVFVSFFSKESFSQFTCFKTNKQDLLLISMFILFHSFLAVTTKKTVYILIRLPEVHRLPEVQSDQDVQYFPFQLLFGHIFLPELSLSLKAGHMFYLDDDCTVSSILSGLGLNTLGTM